MQIKTSIHFYFLLLSYSSMPERFSEFAKLDENQRYVNNHLEKKIKKLKENLIKYNIDKKKFKNF